MGHREALRRQRDFFKSNGTRSIPFRVSQLKRLGEILRRHETALYEAIQLDFGKSRFETCMTELALIHGEINLAIRNLPYWSRKRRVPTNLANFPARSFIIPEPLGNTLVIGAWNFPYQLSLIPAISAIAAGCTVIVKPSELSSNASHAMAELINEAMDPAVIRVVEGGAPETTQLLDERFDKVFFTGSTSVGRIVYQAAARHLTPVTLELGGQNPAIVLQDCALPMAARRITWGKFLNAGQSCVAPNHVWVHRSLEDELLSQLRSWIQRLFGENWSSRENYVRIISDKHVDRLAALIDPEKVFVGGRVEREERFIQPTVLRGVTPEDPVLEDELFGPILPVLTFEDIEEPMEHIKSRPRPLALYVFSRCRRTIDKILTEVPFGGGAVNDTVLHFTNPHLPFGGVGQSGIGSCHGEAGFRTFSHFKSILDKPCWFEPFLKYPPYTRTKQKLLQLLLE
ncbi:MAG: aldehyde dehydrogenase [Syntrophobacteraceae bacterium]|jgi:aldehyde dehydrogenase (NAD+)|nr:aldehyde dehydrogenase [Syntrophobacteraceae bacterium]